MKLIYICVIITQRWPILAIVLSLLMVTQAYSMKNKNDNDKERAAILDFKAHNCPQSIAKAVTDIVSARIFETHIFTIVERNQIDKVFEEMELQKSWCTDSECAVKVGRLLSANKIIIGAIHKIDTYYILLRIVNVAIGKVEGNYKVKADEESRLEEACIEIVEMLEYDFKTETYLSYSISFGFQYAIGDYSKVGDDGYGFNLNLNVNNFIYKNAVLTISTGIYSFDGADDSIESIITAPIMLNLGYIYKLSRKIRIVPYLGCGYFINMMTYDKDGVDQFGDYEYSRENFYDPVASARCDLEYIMSLNLHIFLSPNYTYFFEKSNTGQILGADAGVKMFY
ncbi:MAG: CsgG/HfaB family protein [Spirochaetota bacterium]|nr:CsgG/HfaB family protein [Spirochaetota bacterium]